MTHEFDEIEPPSPVGYNEVRISIMKDTRPSQLYRGKRPEMSFEDLLQMHIISGDAVRFKQVAKDHKSSLMNLRNQDGETLLHTCIKNNQNQILEYLLNAVRDETRDQDQYINWLEQRLGRNRLAALHLAAFYGNTFAIRKLIALGAKATIASKSGLTIVHLAAQGNQPLPLVLFKEGNYRRDFFGNDKEGNNALHWACKFGAVSAAAYLVKYFPENLINKGNNKGVTPLHLAVESSIQSGDTGVLKTILFAGAKRSITDKMGRIPMDYAICPQNNQREEGIVALDEIVRVLQDPKECECLMLKRPIKKSLPSRKLSMIFIFLHSLNFAYLFLIAIPSTASSLKA